MWLVQDNEESFPRFWLRNHMKNKIPLHGYVFKFFSFFELNNLIFKNWRLTYFAHSTFKWYFHESCLFLGFHFCNCCYFNCTIYHSTFEKWNKIVNSAIQVATIAEINCFSEPKLVIYSGWPNYYTHFIFVSRINSPNIDNWQIKIFL